jgi:hypothetical protein
MDNALRDVDAAFASVDDVLVCSVDRLKPHLGTGPVVLASPRARGRPLLSPGVQPAADWGGGACGEACKFFSGGNGFWIPIRMGLHLNSPPFIRILIRIQETNLSNKR